MKTAEHPYFKQRMALLGITDEQNKIALLYYDSVAAENLKRKEQVFRSCDKGLEIIVYTLDRCKIPIAKEGSRWRNKEYSVIRLAEPKIRANGSVQKYDIPKGQPAYPFFPPALLDKYEAAETIPVLYLTEGYIKAFKSQMHGIDCVGLLSVTCMKDRETGKLHADITLLIERCNVQRIVWLTDGDCRDISGKEITEETDLTIRPRNFYSTVATFQDLLSKVEDTRLYWAHINSNNFSDKPKGIDDLLCAFPGETESIAEEFQNFESSKGRRYDGKYLVRFEVTHSISKVYQYFFLQDVTLFYLHHVEYRTDLKGRQFRFYGSLYKYDEKDGKCIIVIPSCAADYFRAGDTYYEFIEIPDHYGNSVRTFHKRDKRTIQDDHGNSVFKHIPKYKAFCNVPGHVVYQRFISNCFNLYAPFNFEPEEGECFRTLTFIQHVFGNTPVVINETLAVPRYELGLDYLSILYRYPQQILPILCLVSRERQTGKTTFNKWLKMIFEENMAIVGNQDLASEFNSHWAGKLIIACDETKIDKHVVLEKVKSLSTASEIMMNAKNRDHTNMKFFGKFILNSNNEDNFINIEEDEIRFWVIKVPVIEMKDVEILEDLYSEIPAFLHYLNKRNLVTAKTERHWFDTSLLKTDALRKVKENSRPGIEKQLRICIAELFIATEMEVIYMSLATVVNELLKRPNEKVYVNKILDQMGYSLGKPMRASFPRVLEITTAGNSTIDFIMVKYAVSTRCYEFHRADFVEPGLPAPVIPVVLPPDIPADLFEQAA